MRESKEEGGGEEAEKEKEEFEEEEKKQKGNLIRGLMIAFEDLLLLYSPELQPDV